MLPQSRAKSLITTKAPLAGRGSPSPIRASSTDDLFDNKENKGAPNPKRRSSLLRFFGLGGSFNKKKKKRNSKRGSDLSKSPPPSEADSPSVNRVEYNHQV